MNLLQTIFFIPLFILAASVAFYIPGRVLIGKQQKSNTIITSTCAFVVGIVVWGWQGFLFGYLQLRFLSYVYLFIFVVIYLGKKYYAVRLSIPKQVDWLAVGMLIVGVFGQTASYISSGFLVREGMNIGQFNQPDHMWHTSLINEMTKRFPPYEPGMYGILVSNYHYWFNLVTAELIRVFHLPLFQTQYIGMYVMGSLLLGLTAYTFSTSILKSKTFVRLLFLFLYFAGDASYILSFLTVHTFNFHVPSIIENATLFMDNPPRAYSTIILFVTVYLLFTKVRSKEKNYFFILALLVSSLVGFKIYTGITVLFGLFSLAIFDALHKKWRTFFIFLSAVCLSAIIFIPVNANSGGIFFNPFDIPRDFITYHPLGLNDMELRWIVYSLHKNYFRLLEYGLLMTGIYFFAEFGVRCIGFIPYKKAFKVLGKEKSIFLYCAMVFPILFGLFFSQKAHASDSFNFFVSGLFFLTIVTSLHLALFLEKRNTLLVSLVGIILLCIVLPRWVISEYVSIPNLTNFYGISSAELTSYTFLREKTPPDSMILVMNQGHLDENSAVVSIFSDRNMYLSGLGVIQAHNAENKERNSTVHDIETNKNPSIVLQTLQKAKITYVYVYNDSKVLFQLQTILKHKVFHNAAASIFKI